MQRSLWPREHGAYAQIAAPLVAALAAHAPTLAGALLAIAACAAFVAHEPLLVVIGHRGVRRRDVDGARATRRLACAAGLALVAGAAGLVLAAHADASEVLAMCGAVALLGAIVLALAWRRALHSLAGELVAACALAGAAAPVAVASDATPRAACAAWLAWFVGFACTVVAVHHVIARHKAARTRADLVVPAILFALTSIAVAALAFDRAAAIALPLAASSTVLALRPPPATRLRAIGVAFVVAALAADATAIATRAL